MSELGKVILNNCFVENFDHLCVPRKTVVDAAVKLNMYIWEAMHYATKIGVWIVD